VLLVIILVNLVNLAAWLDLFGNESSHYCWHNPWQTPRSLRVTNLGIILGTILGIILGKHPLRLQSSY